MDKVRIRRGFSGIATMSPRRCSFVTDAREAMAKPSPVSTTPLREIGLPSSITTFIWSREIPALRR